MRIVLNAKAFANAATIVTVVFYVACWLISSLAPDLIFGLSKAWMHSINIESLKATTTISFETVLLGLFSISLLTWITMYATIWLYNQLAKK